MTNRPEEQQPKRARLTINPARRECDIVKLLTSLATANEEELDLAPYKNGIVSRGVEEIASLHEIQLKFTVKRL